MTTITWQTWIEINAGDAKRMGLKEGDVVTVATGQDGERPIEAIVYPHPAAPPGVVGIPVGLGHHTPGLEYATRDGEKRGHNPISILETAADEAGGLAWAATRVQVRPTGRNVRVSKFEGIVPALSHRFRSGGHRPGDPGLTPSAARGASLGKMLEA